MYIIENINEKGESTIVTLTEDANIYAECEICGNQIDISVEELIDSVRRDGLSGTRYCCSQDCNVPSAQ